MRRILAFAGVLLWVLQPTVAPAAESPRALGHLRLDGFDVRLDFDVSDDATAGDGWVYFRSPVAAFNYVLEYRVDVSNVVTTPTGLRYSHQIPSTDPHLGGLWIVTSVTDGGAPAHDTVSWYWTWDGAEAAQWLTVGGPLVEHDIAAGNIVVRG